MQPQQTWIDAALAMPWIAWSIGGLLIALGILLLWRFLFSDRSRGRRRCPRCWYDMRGTEGLRCSECGYEARREKALLRTRRRWRAAALALLPIMAGGALLLAPRVHRYGWVSIVPTTVLLRYVPSSMDGRTTARRVPHWAALELDRRDAAESLWSWQWRYLVTEKNGLRFRPVWPADQPLVVQTTFATWGKDWMAVPLPAAERPRLPRPTPGVLPKVEIQIIPTAQFATPGTAKSGVDTYWRGSVALPVQTVPTISDAMTRRAGPEFDELMRRAIQIQAVVDGYNNTGDDRSVTYTTLWCVFDRTIDPRLNNIAFGFRVRIFKGDELVDTMAFEPGYDLRLMRTSRGSAGSANLSASLIGTNQITVANLRSAADWKFEITNYPLGVLCDWHRTEYWDGVIELNSTDGLWVEGRDPDDKRMGPP